MFKELLRRVSHLPAFLGIKPALMKVNLNTSALFNIEARCILVDSAKAAGLSKVSLYNVIEEPIAAGLAYADMIKALPEPLYVIVCDYGGGTFDSSLIKIETIGGLKNVSVLASAGVGNCGGVAIDAKFADQLSEEYKLEHVRKDIDKERKFLEEVERAKMLLSKRRNLNFNVLVSPGEVISCFCDQERLNDAIKQTKIIEDSLDAIEWTFRVGLASEAVRLPPDDGDVFGSGFGRKFGRDCRVLFVGGTSRIPYIRKSVLNGLHDRELGSKFQVIESSELMMDPIEAVVRGDAYKDSFEGVSLNRPPHKVVLELADGAHDVNDCFEPFLFYRKGRANWHFSSLAIKEHEYSIASPDELILRIKDYYDLEQKFKKEVGAGFEDVLVDSKSLHEGRGDRLSIKRYFNGYVYISVSSYSSGNTRDVGRYIAPWRLDGNLSGFSTWHKPGPGTSHLDEVG
jgi:hypothetical protein